MTKSLKKSESSEAVQKVTSAPPLGEALTGLSRRTGWAIGSLIVRIVAVAALNTILAHQLPWLAEHRALLDALGGVLVLWPFFTALGRGYAWRIALGRTYAREQRWSDADQTLAPFLHPRTRLFFDAKGEGIYWLAMARQALGAGDDARRLWQRLADERRGDWSDRAREQLLSSGAPSGRAIG